MTDLSAINTDGARLPSAYNAAKRAISQCANLDECKDWSDKAQALASYAKQANDDTLLKTAKRIQARAVRRAGELLKQIEPASGARSDLGGAPPRGRAAAAAEAGMSKDQAKQAQRVANVPEDDFEQLVEGDATVTAIAALGVAKKAPADSAKIAGLILSLKTTCEKLEEIGVDELAEGANDLQRQKLKMLVSRLDGILDRMAVKL